MSEREFPKAVTNNEYKMIVSETSLKYQSRQKPDMPTTYLRPQFIQRINFQIYLSDPYA